MAMNVRAAVLGVGFAVPLVFASTSPALACACCTDDGFRHVGVAKLDSGKREEIEKVQFGEVARVYVGPAGLEAVEGIRATSERYHLKVTWEKDRAVFMLSDDAGHQGRLSLLVPEKISIFEVDPRNGEDRGLGPVLYKEWKLTGKTAGSGVFAAGGESQQTLTLIVHGRGNACTSAIDFTHWTLVMEGPKANYTLFGDLVQPQ